MTGHHEAIAAVFNIFHDGWISAAAWRGPDLLLTVEIPYLAERVRPDWERFTVELRAAAGLEFQPWLNQPVPPLTEISAIFQAELDILSCDLEGDRVELVCNQTSRDVAYCGGCLYFAAAEALVFDQGGALWALDRLGGLCESYWTELSRRHRGE